jgi:DNA helicase-2/ATP-dependent DNA helicase PcrA
MPVSLDVPLESSPLEKFLELCALRSDIDEYKEGERVTLMTIHAAKGLEFDEVFVTGLEEGLFPHQRSMENDEQLDEERRLCYVAMTRARRKLTMTWALERMIFGKKQEQKKSRFLGEIIKTVKDGVCDNQLFEAMRVRVKREGMRSGNAFASGRHVEHHLHEVSRYAPAIDLDDDPDDPFAKGKRVRHAKFGEGEIRARSGLGSKAILTIYFPGAGLKKIVAGYVEAV